MEIDLFELTISAENIFDFKWREAQFDTESRLQFEHQHPEHLDS
jgi:hypothetical protein